MTSSIIDQPHHHGKSSTGYIRAKRGFELAGHAIPDCLRKIMEEGRCCACEGPLKGSRVNFIMLMKIATWKFPVWGNIFLTEIGMRAIAVVCDSCEVEKAKAKWAVEIDGDEFRYHEVSVLEDAPPITEEMIEEGEKKMRERMEREGTRYVQL